MVRSFEDSNSVSTSSDQQIAAREAEMAIAVLSHDLRNSLTAIQAGTALLQKQSLTEQGQIIVANIFECLARSFSLINDAGSAARRQLGNASALLKVTNNIDFLLRQVIREQAAIHPDRVVQTEITLTNPPAVDAVRFTQLVSNLLSNALTHGDIEAPVRLKAVVTSAGLEIDVSNSGKQIPEDELNVIYQALKRTDCDNTEHMGLGLHIAAEIANAHGGTLVAISTPDETCFRFFMPS